MDFTFYRTPSPVRWLYPTLLWRIVTNEKIIYLTFDDGPVPGVTEFVLQTLKSFQAKATFFCIGDNIRKHPEIFQKVLAGGHAIGNHTYSHLKGWSTTTEKYLENVYQVNDQLSSVNCLPSTLFRPPYGRITRDQIAALKAYKIVMWDVLTYDYRKFGKVDHQLQGTLSATRPGSIVVFHDSYKAEPKLQYILPRFMEYFTSLGYSFQAITK